MKKVFIATLILAMCFSLSGCFGIGGYGAQQFTQPPQKVFRTVEELAQAVKAAKSSTAADETNLGALTACYGLKTLPDGASLSWIKVSESVVRVAYSFGPAVTDSYDNQMEIVWYRTENAGEYLNKTAQSLMDYDTINIGGMSYLHKVPDASVIVTPAPGSTDTATPTPMTTKYCQLVYWVQDDAAFMAAVPLGFTNEDIGKYCSAVKIDLQ